MSALQEKFKRLKAAMPSILEFAPGEMIQKTETEYYGSLCPFCGQGKDRFLAWPNAGRFWCRKCGQGGDVIDLAMKVRGVESGDLMKTYLNE